MARRPQKVWKLSYFLDQPEMAAGISMLGNPSELRLFASEKSFINIHEDKINMSGGFPSLIGIQGMPSGVRYAGGLIAPQSFPFNMIPSTMVTPIAQHTIKPPLKELIPTVAQLAAAVGSFVGL